MCDIKEEEIQQHPHQGMAMLHIHIANYCKLYGLLTKHEVKMAGYWPSSFFCMFMDLDFVSVPKHTQKRMRSISSHLEGTSLVNKGFIIRDKTPKYIKKIFLRNKAHILSGQDSSVLLTRGANHSARFGSSCPLRELVIQ